MPSDSHLILVIDDESSVRASLRMILEHAGYRVAEAKDGPSGLEAADKEPPDVVLLDVKMPRMDGLEVFRHLRKSHPACPVILISGHGTIPMAVQAMRDGAFDFLVKPPRKDVILDKMRLALEQRAVRAEGAREAADGAPTYEIVGQSPAIQTVLSQIGRAAPTQATVLVVGESGTGKELVARAIHLGSHRRHGPFVQVNCAAIPEDLIENELFGHVKGAYTGAGQVQVGKFEAARDGTIFLDEIGDMSLKTQAKVLRVLEDGEFQRVGSPQVLHTDARVVAATNKDLKEEIRVGRFRQDLFYRLNVIPVSLPPLRERRGDIPLLVNHFIHELCRQNGLPPRRFDDDAMEFLTQYAWPGNVRELRNTVERMVIMVDGDEIGLADLPRGELSTGPTELPGATPSTLREFKEQAERAFLLHKLEEHGWNIKRTAESIDTQRSNLYKRMEQLGIRPSEVRDRDRRA